MRVILHHCGQQVEFDFNPVPLHWKKQASEFLPNYSTGLNGIFSSVFIKRTCSSSPACGHGLLEQLIGVVLPATPTVLGMATDGNRHYYFFENIQSSQSKYQLLEEWIVLAAKASIPQKTILVDQLFQQSTLSAILTTSRKLLDEIWKLGYVYIDFSAKNIFFSPHDLRVSIIDIDSAWTIQQVTQKLRPSAQDCDIKYWAFWNEHAAPVATGNVERAHKTLIFSMAAVWLRAASLASGGNLHGALNFIRVPGAPVQSPIWMALKNRNPLAFRKAFGLPSLNDGIHRKWQQIFDGFVANQNVSWDDLFDAVDDLAKVVPSPVQAVPVKPLYSNGIWKNLDHYLRQVIDVTRRWPVSITSKYKIILARLIPTCLAEAIVILSMVFLWRILSGAAGNPYNLFPSPDIGKETLGLARILLVPVFIVFGLAVFFILIAAVILGFVVFCAIGILAIYLIVNLFSSDLRYQSPIGILTRFVNQTVTILLSPFSRKR